MDGMLRLERNWAEDPYWHANAFWKLFLSNDSFDHVYFVEVFKTVCGDCRLRNQILRHFLGGQRIIHNRYEPDQKEESRLSAIRQCIKLANCKQRKAYITWEYPSITDERGHQESHCIMLIYDPTELEVVCVDSRGPYFARNYCPQWAKSHAQLQRLFMDCTWIPAVPQDMQAQNTDDHFCQTWSLLLAIEIETAAHRTGTNNNGTSTSGCKSSANTNNNSNNDSDDESDSYSRVSDTETTNETTGTIDCATEDVEVDYFGIPELSVDTTTLMTGFGAILAFWRRLIDVEAFKEAIYYELYRCTHLADGSHQYNRYFSTLEALVTGSNSVYYAHGVPYKHTGYTFLEGFIDALTEDTLQRILA